MSALVGAWRLVSFESHMDSGEIRYSLGEDAGGMLIYTAGTPPVVFGGTTIIGVLTWAPR